MTCPANSLLIVASRFFTFHWTVTAKHAVLTTDEPQIRFLTTRDPQMAKKITSSNLSHRLKNLQNLDLVSLRKLWLDFYGAQPSKSMSRNLLIRALAYKIQENALGGIKAPVKKRLKGISSDPGSSRIIELAQWLNRPAIKPGTRMVRSWKGEVYVVTALKDGFEHNGATYSSLSKIACLITGTKWSGPAFFGLNATAKKRRNVAGAHHG
jgi:Protein of unknown function (DUF2924)